ncbi:MAG: 3'-5' exonuclease [Pseudomonadota bacterium]
MHCMTFDIETIPDIESGRQLFGLDGLSDDDVYEAMSFRQLQKTGSDFLPLHLQKIVAISVALRTGDDFRVWTLGDESSSEKEIVQRFFDGVDRYVPDLVSWNGSGFDLPVLHYRALKHGVDAARYWDNGDDNRDFRYNNYLSRFHWRHIDVMDVLAGFQPRGRASLDEIAMMLGLPGKLGMSGDKVWPTYQAGDLKAIRDYCETDVVNTHLVYLAFERMRGRLDDALLNKEQSIVRSALKKADSAHLNLYLDAWQEASRG